MDYAESQSPHDEMIEDKGVRILIDPKAVMFLIGTEMDYARDRLASRFVFRNPNQTEACGCGEFVVIRPATPEAGIRCLIAWSVTAQRRVAPLSIYRSG